MDKNTIIGFVLIALIFIGFTQLNKPTEKQLADQKRYNDSIAFVEQNQAPQSVEANISKSATAADSIAANDTAKTADALGDFSVASTGVEKFYTLENELVKLTFSNKGGRISSAQLKKYSTHDSLPLILFDAKESNMAFTFVTNNNRVVSSTSLYFDSIAPVKKDANGNQVLVLRLKTAGQAYLDFTYTLPANNYMLGFDIKANAMNTVMPAGTNSLEMAWSSKIRQQELGRSFEDKYAAIEYKYMSDDIEKLSETANEEKELTTKAKWIAFKGQFFSAILISKEGLSATKLKSTLEKEHSGYLKSYESTMSVAFDPTGKEQSSFNLFLGPNQYKILSAYDKKADAGTELNLNKIIPLGWGIFGWVNRLMIIPMFNFFSGFMGNFGLIILLMTIAIKTLLFPLTYKSYISSAKMRVLKPEIDEINAKIPADKAVERQKATMEMYSKVGVSPMSGCLPTLLQMPILFAMFSFFPAAIELRQESFLWATDLSAYDSIWSWNSYIPLITPYFGNHVSLFCLLMTATSIVYTKLNMASSAGNEQIPGMKWMMYLMPVAFMFMFNNYASGLSYYYFVSTLISIIQTYAIRGMVDEKKMLAELHAKRNSKKPVKKSGFMARLEKMQQEQQKAVKSKK